jgi:hypothetical protein
VTSAMVEADSLVLLTGAGSPGCLEIVRRFLAHPNVTPGTAFTASGSLPFCPKAAPTLAVHVGTDRTDLLGTALDELQEARWRGTYTGVIMILQSPFQAFLDETDAAGADGGTDGGPPPGPEAFLSWAETQTRSWRLLSDRVRTHHFRITSVTGVLKEPLAEMARLTALIPAYIDRSSQVPDAVELASGDRVRELIAALPGSRAVRQMKLLGQIANRSAGRLPDRETLDQMSRLLA